MENDQDKVLSDVTSGEYKFGFVTDIETDVIPVGLSEDVVRLISSKKEEPAWLLEFRLKAYRHWLTMKMPAWANLKIPEINYQEISFYAAPRQKTDALQASVTLILNLSRHSTSWASRLRNRSILQVSPSMQ